MTKYYISLEADGNFHIIEYDTGEGVRVLRDAGGRETSVVIYHNSLIVSALYDTVEAAIKHLGGSRRETILPDGRVVIPESVNYPELWVKVLAKRKPAQSSRWDDLGRQKLPHQPREATQRFAHRILC